MKQTAKTLLSVRPFIMNNNNNANLGEQMLDNVFVQNLVSLNPVIMPDEILPAFY